jgi:hypothetical protein
MEFELIAIADYPMRYLMIVTLDASRRAGSITVARHPVCAEADQPFLNLLSTGTY